MNENRDLSNIIYCSKCGAEMRNTSRYCMKCGNLNYSHPDNESMKQYAWQNIAQGTYISGVDLQDGGKPINDMLKSKINIGCLVFNIILHLLVPIILTIVKGFSLSVFGIYLAFIILFILNYSMQCVYMKSGKKWWVYFVPIYGQFIFFEIAMNNGLFVFCNFIPIVGIVVDFIAFYKLGIKFSKNGWYTALFPFVMIPIIAFDKNTELSLSVSSFSLSDDSLKQVGKTVTEKEYGRKKLAISLIIIACIAIVLYFVWPFLEIIYDKIIELIMKIKK